MGQLKEGAIIGNNGVPILRAIGVPVLFDGRGNNFNLGVANKWVTLFNLLTPINYNDRVFIGLSIYNPNPTNPVYLAFEAVTGSEVKSVVVEPGADFALDALLFGPGHMDKWTTKVCNLVRAMIPANVGVPASGTATYVSNVSAGNSFTLGANTYTFYATAVPTYQPANTIGILLGASLAASLTNAVAAINAADANVTATASGTVLTITSNWTGTAMNSYAFADISTGGTFTGSGTLASGTLGVQVDAVLW